MPTLRIPTETVQSILRMRSSQPDLPMREIARRLGVGSTTVRKVCRLNPLPDCVVLPSSEAEDGRLDLPDAEHDGFGPKQLNDLGWWLILSDVHIPYHDTAALKLAVMEGQKHDPVGIILNGDIIDAPGLSRFLKDPNVVQIKGGVEKTMQFFGWLRGNFPKSRIIWKCGNHDARLYSYLLANAPALYGLESLSWASITKAAQHGIEVMEDDTQIIHLGKLAILHGHEFIRSFAPPVNAARGLYLRAKTTALCGHHHSTSTHAEKDVKGKQIVTWSTGCLCHLQPRYSRFNSWNHGFALVEVLNRDGDFSVHNKRIFEGRVA